MSMLQPHGDLGYALTLVAGSPVNGAEILSRKAKVSPEFQPHCQMLIEALQEIRWPKDEMQRLAILWGVARDLMARQSRIAKQIAGILKWAIAVRTPYQVSLDRYFEKLL